ncbi:hypothetical protein FR483_n627R [Paramecium bursaria Chlorella virus FR483]|uniref:Uncharacterized protein n627R n=1 Tax=Paramecium bursaria Chlorella virus FR483 TaxID=399781 RepID=A7J7Y1_PBCVF|nr:hypothetical protein FR483_n627R [Paramecium bursaria Chlorella virus FR483]ABT15912.1 hypothetical protein FR483_n627R [Paramecium bursaria Chlorella virus FR483]
MKLWFHRGISRSLVWKSLVGLENPASFLAAIYRVLIVLMMKGAATSASWEIYEFFASTKSGESFWFALIV